MSLLYFTTIAIILSNTLLCNASSRKVTTITFPDCEGTKYKESCATAKKNGLNIVYSKATSPQDSLLYAFSTIGVPTVAIAHTTDPKVEMEFNWDALVNSTSLVNAINFTDNTKVDYKFGVVFTKLIEYDDRNDTADLKTCQKNKGNFTITSFSDFVWKPVDEVKGNMFVFNATFNNGSVSFKFFVRDRTGRQNQFPALRYSMNETQVDFEVDGVEATYNSSRFAVEVGIRSLSHNKDMSIDLTDSIDDEYTPGVFKIADWLSNPSAKSTSGFLQWKPVAYFSKARDRASATEVQHYNLINKKKTESLDNCILEAFFGDNEKAFVERFTNISFGLPKDGFYVKKNYTEWTFAAGYGDPIHDEISSTVIIIISAGLGLPVIIMIFGGIYTIIRKYKGNNQSDYQPIGGIN